MSIKDDGRTYHEITSVKSHDDLESWEITINFEGADRLIDIDYPLEEGVEGEEIAADFGLAVRPGYLLSFSDNGEVHIVSSTWPGPPDQEYIASHFSTAKSKNQL